MEINENKRKKSNSDKNEPETKKKINETDLLENQSAYSETNLEKSILTKQNSIGLEEMLICNICQDIMHNCVSIQPCLHTYCAYCLLKWRKSGQCCPTCRGPLSGVSINHLVRNIIDKYLIQNPGKMQTSKEREEADFEVAQNMNILFSQLDSPTDFPVTEFSLNNCPFCNYPGNRFNAEVTINGLIYSCNTSTNHTQCNCCSRNIPSIGNDGNYPPINCQVCNDKFCFLLVGSCDECITGCLFQFKNFIFNSNLNDLNRVPQFIVDNFYETSILRNYLNRKNLTVIEMYSQCFDKLANGEISLDHSLGESSYVCLRCARKTLMDMVYEYFVSIPSSDFPQEVTSRPNCYYGRNCRTQRHKLYHCTQYNHACPQTRF